MSVLIANEVGIFKCRFNEVRPCKNPEYFNAVLGFELEIGGDVKDCNAFPKSQYLLHDMSDIDKFNGLQEGKTYLMRMSVGYQSPNEKNGKTYPGGVRFRVLQVLKEA